MAARRLVVVMLVLLAISVVAAALLPGPKSSGPAVLPRQPTTLPKPKLAPPPPSGPLLGARMRVSSKASRVRIERGDELRLSVAAPGGDDIEIPGFGLTATATPFAPARFDLLADRTGTFAVRAVSSASPAGWLVVGRPGSGRCGVSRLEAPPAPGSARPCAPRGRHG